MDDGSGLLWSDHGGHDEGGDPRDRRISRRAERLFRRTTLKELKAAYGERLIPEKQLVWGPTQLHFAVSGKLSHLVFYVDRGKVAGFYLTPGKVKKPWGGADVRGIAC